MRALQNLQKAKLKLLGTKCINIIEGPVKAVIILVRKTSDQIQMLVNILKIYGCGLQSLPASENP